MLASSDLDLGFFLLDQELLVDDGLFGDGLLRAQLLVTRQIGAGLVQASTDP